MEMDIQQLIDEFNREFPEEPETSDADVSVAEENSDAETATDLPVENTQSGDEAEPAGAEEQSEPEVESNDPSSEVFDDLSQQVKGRQSPETNRAFAEMRRKLKEAEKAQKFLQRIAEESGLTMDQLVASYEQRRAEQEAQKMGISPEIYQRIQRIEQENRELKKQSRMERFFGQVDSVKAKYGMTDEEIDRTFKFIGQQGLFDPETKVPVIDFEQAYKLANFDSLLQRKMEEARQQMLAEKKRRQQQAAVPHTGVSAATTAQSTGWTDEEVDKELARMGLLDRIR